MANRVPWSMVPIVVLCVIAGSGAGRAIAGIPLWLSLVLTCAVAAWPFAYLCRRLAAFRPAALVTAASLGAVGIYALYDRAFVGQVAFSGTPDAGNHARFLVAFVGDQPAVYAGCVGLYAIVAWFLRLPHAGAYVGFTFVFYATVFSLIAITVENAILRAGAISGRAIVVATVSTAATLAAITLIHLHYYESEGFYPQVFCLLPLVAIWQIDLALRDRSTKLVVLAAGVALVRYTYGLDLPDLALTIAIVLVLDPEWRRSPTRRALAVTASIVLLLAAWKAVTVIRAAYLNWGPFIPYDVRAIAACELLLAALLAPDALSSDADRRRGARIPVIFALVNVAFLAIAKQPPRGPDYYYLKTSFAPLLLVTIASVGSITHALAARTRIVPLIIFAVALASGAYATRMWRDTFDERVVGRAPFRTLKPLMDDRAQRRIERVLVERGKLFGGYLTSFYPLMNFMNSAMGFWNGGIDFYYGKAPDDSRGHCVFWEGGYYAFKLEPGYPQEKRVRELASIADHECVDYQPTWRPDTSRTLCWVCR